MSDCFVLYLLLTCMKKKTSGADKFTNNNISNGTDMMRFIWLLKNARYEMNLKKHFREKYLKTNVSTMMTYTIRMTALHTSKMFILKERMIDIYPVWSIFLPSSCYQDVQHWSAETAAERLVHYSLMMSSISLYTFSTWDYILKP